MKEPLGLSASVPCDGALTTAAIFAALFVALFKSWKNFSPAARFFVLWFWIELLLVSQFVFDVGMQPGFASLAEHFMYLPAAALIALIVLSVDRLAAANRRRHFLSPEIFPVVVAAFYCFFFLMTIQCNLYSRNEIVMLKRTLQFNPRNLRVRNELATLYARAGHFDEARVNFRQVLEIDPANASARISLAKILCDQGLYRECVAAYEKISDPGQFGELLKENLRLARQKCGGLARQLPEQGAAAQQTPPAGR